MEPVGMSAIFKRSRPDRGFDYVHYLGDGDSKAFSAVQNSAPYQVDKMDTSRSGWGRGKPVKNVLPKFVVDAINPVFEALTKDDLLKKCLHGGSQNPNESFHHLIWECCPKTVFVGRRRLELGVFDAVLVFNGGESERLKNLNINPGHHAIKFAFGVDTNHIKRSVYAGDLDHIASRRNKSASVAPDDNYCAGGF
ncbi:hypothetical protein CAPTEDRAFT_216323 [Capitella teleta]|uniref:Uncharacterized protein n=1 Tax=Capitella teleta TaxID=283909 RepID=R7V837_CAPTE|nr:hypothetical protein CAPTEDRAFT_216323 [Capitella teleta]|eukprot:ELU11930.1 hypothetical protein CAPTEDRAFT_216323 [Capitella teleta]